MKAKTFLFGGGTLLSGSILGGSRSCGFFLFLELGRGGGTKGTRYFYGSDRLATGVHDLHPFDGVDVTYTDSRTEFEFADVEHKLVHQVLGCRLDLHAAHGYLKLTTTTNAGTVALKDDGYLNLQEVIGLEGQKIDVAQLVRHRVKLVILYDRFVAFTTNAKFGELKLGRVHQRANVEGLNGKVYRIPRSVKDAGNKSLTAGDLA